MVLLSAVAILVATSSSPLNGTVFMYADTRPVYLLSKSNALKSNADRCDISHFRAVDGNKTVDTPHNAVLIHTALQQCQQIVVPAGQIFKISLVVLPSHRALEQEHGSTLVGSDNCTHYRCV